jgi:hypothetical protein
MIKFLVLLARRWLSDAARRCSSQAGLVVQAGFAKNK